MSNQKAILIVEDDASIRKALHDKLTNEGFTVIEADDGLAGLEKAVELHPDLILLDIVMPKMDGITMAKKLKQDEWGKYAEIIILTNLSESEKLLEAFEAGVQDFLIKTDWKIEEVVKMVKRKISEQPDM